MPNSLRDQIAWYTDPAFSYRTCLRSHKLGSRSWSGVPTGVNGMLTSRKKEWGTGADQCWGVEMPIQKHTVHLF